VKLNFVLAESALELVPKEILRSPAVASDSRRRGVDASRILLDRSLHHSAMARLKDSEKRGRPDLVHAALLSVTGTPLYLDGSVRVLVHTSQDVVLELAERTRIPKSYFRFRGLVEKLLFERSNEGLMKAYGAGIREVLRKMISPDRVFGLSVQGRQTGPEELAKAIVAAKNPCVVVGGFPHGHFSQETLALVDELVRIHERPLEAHVIASRVVYEVEKVAAGIND
jgi:rRNA small subunit pseudouridine methyltransferase Nep1